MYYLSQGWDACTLLASSRFHVLSTQDNELYWYIYISPGQCCSNKIVLKRCDLSWYDLVSTQNHEDDMVAPLTANVCLHWPTYHVALNAIACMCIGSVWAERGGGWYTQRVITVWLCLDMALNLKSSIFSYFCKWTFKTVALPCRASMQCSKH